MLIIGVALWMLARTWREQQWEKANAALGHSHDAEVRRIDTGHGDVLVLEVFEDGVPPHFRVRAEKHGRPSSLPDAGEIAVETRRPDGAVQRFTFADRGDCLESHDTIPEPHEFLATVQFGHVGHVHEYPVRFVEPDHGHHHHDAAAAVDVRLELGQDSYMDAHERAHANDIQRRFAGRSVTTGQIVLFGLTGGLIPCPAAITVLLLCLQVKEITLGAALVLCFSIGLALTLVATGAIAALGVRHAERRWSATMTLIARRAPYVSSALIILVGLYVGIHGLQGLGYTLASIGGLHVS